MVVFANASVGAFVSLALVGYIKYTKEKLPRRVSHLISWVMKQFQMFHIMAVRSNTLSVDLGLCIN